MIICVFKIVREQQTMVLIGQKKQSIGPFLFSLAYSLISVCLLSEAKNTLSKGQQLKDGEFLTSLDGVFGLGFFSTVNSSTSRYLGIMYQTNQDKAIVWIANRNSPISDTNGSLTIAQDGNLVVRDGNGLEVWKSSSNELDSNNTVAALLPTGNFFLTNNVSPVDATKVYWQTFQDPTDTLLPYMGAQFKTSPRESGVFTSWSSETDPSTGNFTMGVDSRGTPQIVIWEESRRIWRSGHWTGASFTGYQGEIKVGVRADGQTYLTYNSSGSYDLLRSQISWDGYLDQSKWDERENKWTLTQRQPANECDKYNYCGNFGVCNNSNNPRCSCMYGFNPRNSEEWNRRNWSGGCWRNAPLRCQNVLNSRIKEDEFLLLSSVKLPDFADVIGTENSYDDCRSRCLRNCSCNAFAYVGGIGCMSWSSDLIDIQHFDESGFNDLYVRHASSELEGGSRISSRIIIIVVLACGVFATVSGWLLWKLKKKSKGMRIPESEVPLYDMNKGKLYSGLANPTSDYSQVNAPDLRMFNFKVVAAATENFSEENILGQGGFGLVYKGQLPGGERIAVKRLSKMSGQGLEELKNEIIMIAKLQHRNLVRLLGWCIQGEEKILLYEFMPNRSLDCFIFDPAMKALLDWPKRFSIIAGIARGLLYLHRDSRLRIIHRDLKASNILLDEDMNPKISDFGMAKIFGANQSEANTTRVVGTFGYMSPEYAMKGLFSVKSDVYSFGVLVLEIVCGRRNTSFRLPDHLNLIAYAWQLWKEGRAIDLLDSSIRNSCSEEVVKCIQVGILCVQDSAFHRPTMQAVVPMLQSNSSNLPQPEQPTFTVARTCMDAEICGDGPKMVSSNDLTVTTFVGR